MIEVWGRHALLFYAREFSGRHAGVLVGKTLVQLRSVEVQVSPLRSRWRRVTKCVNYTLGYTGLVILRHDGEHGVLVAQDADEQRTGISRWMKEYRTDGR